MSRTKKPSKLSAVERAFLNRIRSLNEEENQISRPTTSHTSPREAFPALIVFRNVSGGMGVPSGTCGDEEPRGRNTDINTVSGPNNY
jgi:hypothetical protein